ncbi:hypothetical protein B0T21DRAFT_181802 [Apiosordaria backusii]|uniref:Uncharacterized protein n=1 Tax=Apiosordaria backusii TaxID=314023 RepID=A0AA40BLV3_9PEZI|nr:hypothetical protein B0T21DRAFT_181802 [Apiosordaria backusii]
MGGNYLYRNGQPHVGVAPPPRVFSPQRHHKSMRELKVASRAEVWQHHQADHRDGCVMPSLNLRGCHRSSLLVEHHPTVPVRMETELSSGLVPEATAAVPSILHPLVSTIACSKQSGNPRVCPISRLETKTRGEPRLSEVSAPSPTRTLKMTISIPERLRRAGTNCSSVT